MDNGALEQTESTGARQLVIKHTIFRILTRVQTDHVVDTQNCDGGFSSKLQALGLGNSRLENTGLDTVADLAIRQIQSTPTTITCIG
jgi:hypothetical protein